MQSSLRRDEELSNSGMQERSRWPVTHGKTTINTEEKKSESVKLEGTAKIDRKPMPVTENVGRSIKSSGSWSDDGNAQ